MLLSCFRKEHFLSSLFIRIFGSGGCGEGTNQVSQNNSFHHHSTPCKHSYHSVNTNKFTIYYRTNLPFITEPWELVAAFDNAIVNATLCWFSHMQSFFSGFTVLLIIPERFNLVYNQLNHSLFSVPVLFTCQVQYNTCSK